MSDSKELMQGLRSTDAETRRRAYEFLAEIDDVDPVPYLIGALNDEDWGVQTTAARALGATEDPAAIEPLIHVLTDAQNRLWETRQAAMRALASLGSWEPIEDRMLKDPDFIVRLEAAGILGEFARLEVAPGLEAAAENDEDVRVREAARQARLRLEL
ncbi:MAG: HEAT repeat domain-containing protein [Actinobacteria bacterium]|nr:HEAT repeat domain-containing protein [Actinomycetota bacterium]